MTTIRFEFFLYLVSNNHCLTLKLFNRELNDMITRRGMYLFWINKIIIFFIHDDVLTFSRVLLISSHQYQGIYCRLKINKVERNMPFPRIGERDQLQLHSVLLYLDILNLVECSPITFLTRLLGSNTQHINNAAAFIISTVSPYCYSSFIDLYNAFESCHSLL